MIRFVCIFFVLIFFPLLAKEPFRSKKNLVLIEGTNRSSIDKAQMASWRRYMHKFPEIFACWFVQAHPDLHTSYRFQKDVLWLKHQDSHVADSKRNLLRAMEVFMENIDGYDYVICVHQSSFLVLPILCKFLENLPLEKVFSREARNLNTDDTKSLCCGLDCAIFSKDIVRSMVENKKYFNQNPSERNRAEDLIDVEFLDPQQVFLTNKRLYSFEGILRRPLKVLRDIGEEIFYFKIKLEGDEQVRYRGERRIHQELFQIYYEGLVELDRF